VEVTKTPYRVVRVTGFQRGGLARIPFESFSGLNSQFRPILYQFSISGGKQITPEKKGAAEGS